MNRLKGKSPSILVIGDLMIDHYLWGNCERVSPEAPVPIIDIESESLALGGAGNVANNLIKLGAKVEIATVLGEDEVAKELLKMLSEIGVKSNLTLYQSGRKSSKKSRIISSHQQVLRVDRESRFSISKELELKLIDLISENLDRFDAVILSDYGKGVLTTLLIKNIIHLANERGKKVFIDPKGSDYSKYSNAYLITPNRKEASLATQMEIVDDESLKKVGFQLKEELNLNYSIITLSEDGVAIFDRDMLKISTKAKEVFDVTGAGDTVIASIAFAISSGLNIVDACKFANYCAAVVVGKVGSATATLEEVDEYISSINRSNSSEHIKSLDEVLEITKELKRRQKRVVFTNGCFDILHIGHIKYLEKAKNFGDVLILGLNSDESIKRLKGESRPINSQSDRAYILASLEVVDYVVIFDEDTPYNLIKAITPDILVKGGDYRGKEVVGSDIAKETKLVDFVDGKSTTKIVQKIQGKN